MRGLHPVVGHEGARRALAAAHASGGIPASLLMHGPTGVGKQRLALWTGQLQLCEALEPEGPCDRCRPCRMALALEHPDLHWYFPVPRPKGGMGGERMADALESARIEALADLRSNPIRASLGDELRGIYLGLVQGVRRRAYLRPTMAATSVFVIGDAEYLVPQESSPEAANALLKLLEEPPAGSRFILTTSAPGRLLPTIRSRTVPLHLGPLPRETVLSFLQEHAGIGAAKAAWAADLSQGSIGRALAFLPESEEEEGHLEARRREGLALVEAALQDGRAAGFALALSQSSREGRRLVELLAFVEEWLRDLAAVAAGAEETVLSRDSLPHLRALVAAREVHPWAVATSLAAVEEARGLARGNVNPQLIVAELVRRLHGSIRGR